MNFINFWGDFMALMFPSDYKEWLEKQSLRTIQHERVKILSFMYRYENDRLASHEIDSTTPSKYVYWNAKRLLEVLKEVEATKKQNQDK